jgi:hypothetical protein
VLVLMDRRDQACRFLASLGFPFPLRGYSDEEYRTRHHALMSWAPSWGLMLWLREASGVTSALNAGALSRGLLAVSGVICGSSAGGGIFFLPPPANQPGGRFGRPRACLGATRAAPPPPREGAVPSGQPRSK